MSDEKISLNYEDMHVVCLARELTFAAGVPFRDRYGFASSDEDVLAVVTIVRREPVDAVAAEAIGIAGALGDIELAMGYDTHTDAAFELRMVEALRPLIEQRRDAGVRSMKP
jgi:hypothetical protein